jgi:hypothetical protein
VVDAKGRHAFVHHLGGGLGDQASHAAYLAPQRRQKKKCFG